MRLAVHATRASPQIASADLSAAARAVHFIGKQIGEWIMVHCALRRLAAVLVVVSLAALSACSTVAGMGRDIEAIGGGVSGSGAPASDTRRR